MLGVSWAVPPLGKMRNVTCRTYSVFIDVSASKVRYFFDH